eukprot:gene25902-34495_t
MEVVKDQRADAMKYLEKHKILKLFDILGAKLVKRKPTFPNEFLVSELETILEAKTMSNPVTLFAESDLEIMFSIFDITNRGYITQTQYAKALDAVGISTPTKPPPPGDQIDKMTFVSHLYEEILKDSY